MVGVKIICVGKMHEKHYISAAAEYVKRLLPLCKLEIEEQAEVKLPDNPSKAQIEGALSKEAEKIVAAIPKKSYVIAMCIEGKMLSSEALAHKIETVQTQGDSKICFIIGSSFGMDESVKKTADLKLSMSEMTFPHHLARVMLLEQIYRAFQINNGSKYHK